MTCDLCSSYRSAAPDPIDSAQALVICSTDRVLSLVRLGSESCELLIDGTTFGSRHLTDLTVVRTTL